MDIKYAIIFTNYFTTAKVITLKYVVLQLATIGARNLGSLWMSTIGEASHNDTQFFPLRLPEKQKKTALEKEKQVQKHWLM